MASAVIGSLRVDLSADSAQFQSGLKKAGAEANTFSGKVKKAMFGVQAANDNARKSVLGLGGAFTKLAGIITGVLASALAAVSLRNFIQATVEADQVQAQLAASLRSTAAVSGQTVASLNETAAALQKVTNFGDEAINAAQGLLLTFTRIRGEKFNEATTAVLNVATAMKIDLKSAAIQVGKALNDPEKGLSALSRSGITFSESQKEMVKQMVATGDIVGAQTLILKELETQFGGSAKAAREVLGGALISLRNAWGDLFELGKSATEPLRLALEGLIVAIQNPAFVTFVKTIGAGLVMAFALAVDGATLLVNAISLVVDNIDTIGVAALTAGTMLGIAFGPAIFTAIITGFVTMARAGVAAIYAITAAMARNPLGALAVGITIAITALYHFRDNVQQAVGVDVIGIIKNAANAIINSFRAAFEDIVFVWNNLPDVIGAVAIGAANATIAAVEGMLNRAGGLINTFISGVNSALGAFSDVQIGTIGKFEIGRIENTALGRISGDLAAHKAKIDSIMASDPLGSLGQMFSTTTPEIEDFSGAIAGANASLDELGGDGGKGGGKAGKAAKAAKGLKDIGKAAKEAADEAAKAAKAVMDFAADITKSFVADLRSGLEQGKGFWRSFKDAALGALDSIATKLINLGIDQMFAGLAGGLGSGGGGGLFSKLFAGFFAGGGTIPRGQFGIVGENGPEFAFGPREIVPMGEMVATDADSRGGGAEPQADRWKIVNAIDGASFLSEALSSQAGERVILNHVRANSGAFKQALG